LISPDKGTRTLLWLVNGTPGTTWTPGLYYARNKPKIPNPQAGDDALAAALWGRSTELAGLTAWQAAKLQEREAYGWLLETADAKEGFSSFLQQRPPRLVRLEARGAEYVDRAMIQHRRRRWPDEVRH